MSLNSHPTVASVWVTMSPGAFQKFAIFVVEILDGKRFICNVAYIWMIKSKWYQRSYIRVTYYIRVQHDPPKNLKHSFLFARQHSRVQALRSV